MSMHEIPELDNKGLRDFGLTTGAIVALLFGALLPWLLELGFPRWPWVLCAVLAIFALLAPALLAPVYKTWMRFGLLMSRITTPLILGMVFFLVILPMGLCLRIFSRDPMQRKLVPSAASYRVTRPKAEISTVERPY